MKRLISSVPALFLFISGFAAAQSTETEVKTVADKIELLVAGKEFEKAEQALDAALNSFPDSRDLTRPLKSLLIAEMEARRNAQAVQYAEKHFERSLTQFSKDPQRTLLVQEAKYLIAAAQQAAMNERAVERLDGAIQAIKLQARKETTPEVAIEVATQHADMISALVQYLAEIKQFGRAKVLLETEQKEARLAYEFNREDIGATVALTRLLDAQSGLFDRSPPSKEGAARDAAARKELHEVLAASVKEHPAEREFVSLYLYTQEVEFRTVVKSDPPAAERILNGLKTYLAELDVSSPKFKTLTKMRHDRSIPAMSRMLESAKAHLELLGKPAPKFDVETWINGGPLSEKDRAGKVVLMWCGPCIDTFSQLTEWHDKYADKGLVILGLTQYYGFDWNVALAEPERKRGLAPELERAALIKFAAHHKLKHRIALIPEKSELTAAYGVKSIPQAVLIDRAGKVRMIRVGSGSRNAYDLEQAIEQAVSEVAPAGGK